MPTHPRKRIWIHSSRCRFKDRRADYGDGADAALLAKALRRAGVEFPWTIQHHDRWALDLQIGGLRVQPTECNTRSSRADRVIVFTMAASIFSICVAAQSVMSFDGRDASQSAREEGSFDLAVDFVYEDPNESMAGTIDFAFSNENEKQLPCPGTLSTDNFVP